MKKIIVYLGEDKVAEDAQQATSLFRLKHKRDTKVIFCSSKENTSCFGLSPYSSWAIIKKEGINKEASRIDAVKKCQNLAYLSGADALVILDKGIYSSSVLKEQKLDFLPANSWIGFIPNELGPIAVTNCGFIDDKQPKNYLESYELSLLAAKTVLGVANPKIGFVQNQENQDDDSIEFIDKVKKNKNYGGSLSFADLLNKNGINGVVVNPCLMRSALQFSSSALITYFRLMMKLTTRQPLGSIGYQLTGKDRGKVFSKIDLASASSAFLFVGAPGLIVADNALTFNSVSKALDIATKAIDGDFYSSLFQNHNKTLNKCEKVVEDKELFEKEI